MGNLFSEIEASLKVVATKSYNDETGLVNISGWRGCLSEETPILFTVVDKANQAKWTRLIEQSASKRDTLKVKVPRSAVHHQIVTTAELLRENYSRAMNGVAGLRSFTVESTSTCLAIATPGSSQQELLTSLSRSSSANKSKKDFPTKISLNISRPSTDLARLHLTKSSKCITRWLVTIVEVETSDRKDVFLLPAAKEITDFEFLMRNGREYRVEAIGLDGTGGNIFCRGSTNYKAGEEVKVGNRMNGLTVSADLRVTSNFKLPLESGRKLSVETIISNVSSRSSTSHKTGRPTPYTLDELRQLHRIAVANTGQQSAPCVWLYRNKSQKYFLKIFQQKDKGIMKPYPKDNSGDPRSPINGRVQGLFFMASVRPGSKIGEPIPDSAFGTHRILVPAGELLAKAPNLYFTDFYCMNGMNHYVTLVMTRPDSNWDRFCANRLLSLSVCDRSSNPFFFYDCSSSLFHVSTKKHLIVELLFTESLDIRKYLMIQTPIGNNCRGHSKNGGIPKNPTCTKCNLPSSNQS